MCGETGEERARFAREAGSSLRSEWKERKATADAKQASVQVQFDGDRGFT